MYYEGSYSYTLDEFNMEALMPILVVTLALMVLYIIGLWKIYKKAGEPGWGAIIPFYNQYILAKITLGNGWLFLLLFIPIVNIIMLLVMMYRLATVFGRSGLFGVGLIFLPFIFTLVLGFGKSEYIGNQVEENNS